MRGMMRKLILVMTALFFFGVISAQAKDIYIAQSASGSANGTSCANAHASAFFNTAGNWGSGTNQIGPGTTLHLCGTFSSNLQFQGDGTSGNPITLFAESGANFTAPTWTTGVIQTDGHSYLILDGGTNGVIQATNNGTSLTYQEGFSGISMSPCGHDVEIRNWTIQNIFQRTSGSTDTTSGGSQSTSGIWGGTVCGSNISIHNNTVSYAHTGIGLTSSGSPSNWSVYHNTVTQECWGINLSAANSSASISGLYVYGNEVNMGPAWYDPADAFHMDGIFIYGQGGGVNISNIFIYDNYLHGTFGGGHVTAQIYINQNLQNLYVFNNLFDATAQGGVADGLFYFGYGTATAGIYNNTFLGGSGTTGGIAIESVSTVTGMSSLNNVIQNFQGAYYLPSPVTVTSIDHGLDYNITGTGTSAAYYLNGSGKNTFAQWQSAGYDTHGSSGNPNVTTSGYLNAGSPAIGLGTNLYSICNGQPNPGLGALCFDKNGIARPASGNWDAGAFNYGSVSSGAVQPPTGLTATVQ